MSKVTIIGKDGKEKEVDLKLSPKEQTELDTIRLETKKMLAPLYKELGVDDETEELHWTNGEVFVINKKTRERRELKGTQQELNNRMMKDAVEFVKKMNAKEKN